MNDHKVTVYNVEARYHFAGNLGLWTGKMVHVKDGDIVLGFTDELNPVTKEVLRKQGFKGKAIMSSDGSHIEQISFTEISGIFAPVYYVLEKTTSDPNEYNGCWQEPQNAVFGRVIMTLTQIKFAE